MSEFMSAVFTAALWSVLGTFLIAAIYKSTDRDSWLRVLERVAARLAYFAERRYVGRLRGDTPREQFDVDCAEPTCADFHECGPERHDCAQGDPRKW